MSRFLEEKIIHKFLKTFDYVHYGRIWVTMPDGQMYAFSGSHEGPTADIVIHDNRAILALAYKGDIGFAESYRDGWWDSADLASLFEFGLKNEETFDTYIYGSFLSRLATRFAYLFTRNTLKGSKKNIHAHYDLGNEFYRLWLDPSMTYSSALFTDDTQDLTAAQHSKYDRIINRLNPTGSLLEIGCGWGGFAERALQERDYRIKGLTISKEQHDYATQRLHGHGATISLEDYRLQKGKYNQIVSIEMFEAVGERYWKTYFSQLKRLLANKGKAIVQTITINEKYFERYRKGGDPIRTFIFPGGMLPSPERFAREGSHVDLKVTDQFMFGRDYAKTLRHWLNNFEAKLDSVRALGFDEPFIRMWRFYLTCCIASFNVGRTNVMQTELQHVA